jgi:diaminopimelate epimerase
MGALANQAFVKMNGIGNEIVVVDMRARGGSIAPEEARAVAAPDGAPYDQLMVLYPSRTSGTDAFIPSLLPMVRGGRLGGRHAPRCRSGGKGAERTLFTFETTAGYQCQESDGLFTVDAVLAALQVE